MIGQWVTVLSHKSLWGMVLALAAAVALGSRALTRPPVEDDARKFYRALWWSGLLVAGVSACEGDGEIALLVLAGSLVVVFGGAYLNPADSGLADYVALIAGGDSLLAERILLHAEQDEKLVTGERFGRPVIAMTRVEWIAGGNPDVGQGEVVRVSLRRTERR